MLFINKYLCKQVYIFRSVTLEALWLERLLRVSISFYRLLFSFLQKNWFSYVHRQSEVYAIVYLCLLLLMFQAFASALKRPAVFPIPEIILKILYDPERANMLLTGQYVISNRIQNLGFNFHYKTINEACKEVARIFPLKLPVSRSPSFQLHTHHITLGARVLILLSI